MKYVNLGRSGLKVSRLCLGCMSYGEPERLPQPWSLDEKASRPLIRQALEAGINFFDTANTYSDGSSEEITGKALREMARRDEIVVATKTFFPWRNSPNTGFLSRKAIFQSIDDSLMRLGMDYVDLFQIHRFDYSTSVEGSGYGSRRLVMHHLAHKLELPITKKGFINLVITRHKPGALLPRGRARFRRDSSWCRLIA